MKPTNAKKALQEHRKIWFEKPVLREIYLKYFEKIKNALVDGPILEIGGGSGNFKEFLPESISIDVVLLPWLDSIAHAQMLPFKKESIGNIVMVDVLHHIENPSGFFKEAERVLKPGGRIIMIEPAITPVSRLCLHLFHSEPINMDQDPFVEPDLDPTREPFDANQAIPTLLFGHYRSRLLDTFPSFRIVELTYQDVFVYALSGGFRSWCLIPNSILRPLYWFDERLKPFMGSLMAFRLYCILEKKSDIP